MTRRSKCSSVAVSFKMDLEFIAGVTADSRPDFRNPLLYAVRYHAAVRFHLFDQLRHIFSPELKEDIDALRAVPIICRLFSSSDLDYRLFRNALTAASASSSVEPTTAV